VLTPLEMLTYKSDRKDDEPTEKIKLHRIEFMLPANDDA